MDDLDSLLFWSVFISSLGKKVFFFGDKWVCGSLNSLSSLSSQKLQLILTLHNSCVKIRKLARDRRSGGTN